LNGRFAPSPTGALHLGNLRTALAAWLLARASGGRFVVRMEDLDLVVARNDIADRQLEDLAAVGIDWDGPVVFQSERLDRYRDAVTRLKADELTYPCYCTRREIREAASAPNSGPQPDGAYPGTCRDLGQSGRNRLEADGRRPALRLRSGGVSVGFTDAICGETVATVDDLVLVRNDGVFAYNLAVVVDDAAQGVGQVVRGDDLLLSTPRQMYLARLLGLPVPSYAHVPLVLGPDGERLAKRHGAVSLADLQTNGWSADQVRALLLGHLGLPDPPPIADRLALLGRVSMEGFPRTPWQLAAGELEELRVRIGDNPVT
jgi:glutamyl-tRNA synthetase